MRDLSSGVGDQARAKKMTLSVGSSFAWSSFVAGIFDISFIFDAFQTFTVESYEHVAMRSLFQGQN